jgi:tRNA A-37 threonylcarbamoyl transferase component Bud32|nr:protein kinase [Kofleriaceae bacterium]
MDVTQPGDHSAPVLLDLPKGLVSEVAFRWPADPIARGGMAVIFAGEDRRLGRPVILKAPREGDELPAGMAEMFQRRVTAEAKILAKLRHPAIVTIYELGRTSVGWPFCVMQQVDGVALRDRLDELATAERDGTPRTRERLELLSNLVAIAEALAYAHERRVVHRDCTPNNILLGKRGEATLIDWGIARDLDAPGGEIGLGTLAEMPPSASGRMVTISAGTPPYLPLEQTQGRAADPSFDVYSFGVTLYEVVAGRTPFEWVPCNSASQRAKQLDEFLHWLKSDDALPPAMPKDPELSGIIARAMSRDAAHRFTADELVTALKQYLTGDLVFSHRYSRTGRLARWARRNRGAAVALTAIVIAGVASALVWGQLKRQQALEATAENDAMVAKQEAREKADAAEAAEKDAAEARKQADDAAKQGKSSDVLRAAADRKARTALALEGEARTAARHAEGTANEAKKAKEEADAQRAAAEKDRDDAQAAQTEADSQRDVAQSARTQAERDRDTARSTAAVAERDRDTARAAESTAERDRDAAHAAQSAAEKDRDDARSAQSAAEKERDDARKQLVVLEAKLKAAEAAHSSGPSAPPTTPPTTPPTGPALDPQ